MKLPSSEATCAESARCTKRWPVVTIQMSKVRIFRSVWVSSKWREMSPVMGLSLRAHSPVTHVTCKADISAELPLITQNSVHCAAKQNSTIGARVTEWTGPLTKQTVGAARYVRHAHNIAHSYCNFVLSWLRRQQYLICYTNYPHFMKPKRSLLHSQQSHVCFHQSYSFSVKFSYQNFRKSSRFIHKKPVSGNHKNCTHCSVHQTAHTVQHIKLHTLFSTSNLLSTTIHLLFVCDNLGHVLSLRSTYSSLTQSLYTNCTTCLAIWRWESNRRLHGLACQFRNLHGQVIAAANFIRREAGKSGGGPF